MSEKPTNKDRKQDPKEAYNSTITCFTPPPEDPASGEEGWLETAPGSCRLAGSEAIPPHLFNKENTNINGSSGNPPISTANPYSDSIVPLETVVTYRELGNPSFLPSSRERKKESKIVRLLTYDGKTWINVSYKMPPNLARDLKLFCIQNGLRLQEAHASIVAWFIGGQFISDFSGSKKNLQKDIQVAEVRELLQAIRDARKNDIRNPIYLRKQLSKAAKKIRLPAEVEEQVRKELNL